MWRKTQQLKKKIHKWIQIWLIKSIKDLMNEHFLNVPLRTARLEMTDELISSLDGAAQEEELSRDIQRMQELLSLPKNEEKAASSAAEGGT